MEFFKLIQADAVIKNNIGTAEQRQELKDYAYKQKDIALNNGFQFSNDGCWRHDFKYPMIDWLIAEIRHSTNTLINHYAQEDPIYKEKLKVYGTPDLNYWTNINEPGARMVMHDHRLHHYVACYYIQGTDTGELIWHNPMNVTQSCHPHSPFVSRYSYAPSDGDLVVWPGWMPHEIATNHSNRDRVNIAFNLRFETPRYM